MSRRQSLLADSEIKIPLNLAIAHLNFIELPDCEPEDLI